MLTKQKPYKMTVYKDKVFKTTVYLAKTLYYSVKIPVRQKLACLTFDYAPGYYLNQVGGRLCPPHYYVAPQIFSPSDGQLTLSLKCRKFCRVNITSKQ